VEAKLNLDPKKLRATRQVLSEYGNMSSACVHFILDEMRNPHIDIRRVPVNVYKLYVCACLFHL